MPPNPDLAYVVVAPDGSEADDFDGRRFEFYTREQAQRWCPPGSRVKVVRAGKGVRPIEQ